MHDELDKESVSVSVSTDDEGRDELLVGRIKKRDEGALAELFKIHSALLRTVISRVVHNEHDVDEVLSEVMYELWLRADNFDETKGKVLGWLVTLARRRAIDRIRRRQAYWRAVDNAGLIIRHETNVVERHDWESDFDKDRHRRLNELLHGIHIPDEQRECLILHYMEGLSQRQMAERTGLPLGTIKTRLELGFRKIASLVTYDKAFRNRE